MKKHSLLLILICAIGINVVFAQFSDENWEMLLIREDVVKASQLISYEESLLDLINYLTETNAKDVNYFTHLQDNYNYSHITMLNDLDDIEGGLRAFIKGKTNSDRFNLIWDELNETLESYRFYVIKYDPDMSYVPDGSLWLEEAPYRKWNYFYFKPGSEEEVDQILAAWKNLYEQKGIDNGFRIFRGAIGIEQPSVIFTSWAKSPLEHHQNLEENIELLGEEGSVLWLSMIELARKIETIEGWYQPEYSYQPK